MISGVYYKLIMEMSRDNLGKYLTSSQNGIAQLALISTRCD